ncbi:MAG: GH25 family lysozyme [Hominimerdicola sp.]
MTFYKRAVGIALSLIMSAQVCGSVYAADFYETDEKDTSSVSTEGTMTEENIEQDPSYGKFLESQIMCMSRNSTIWGADNLTHASRFENSEKTFGIDVSYYQGDIDWTAVKASGIEYVIIRVGYRGYGSAGTLVVDGRFDEYIQGAKAAGLDVGVYFYTQAINTTEAKAEANFVLNKIKNYDLDLPVYYDIESVDYDTGRLDSANLTKAQKTNLCRAFCDTIKAAGYEAGVYTNYYWFTYQIDGQALGQEYPIWLAHYSTSTDYPYEYQMWQYTGQGKVNGIQNAVDMNVRYTDASVDEKYKDCKVTNLGYSDSSQTKIMLKWDAVKNASGYAIYIKNADGSYSLNATSTTNAYTVTGLNMATVYTFNVRPYFNEDGSTEFVSGKSKLGGYSNDFVRGTKTSKAYGVTVTGQTSRSISIKWDAASGKCDGYQVAFYDTNTKKHKAVAYTTSTSYTFNNLISGSDYNVTVRPYYIENGVKYPGVFADYVKTATAPGMVSGVQATAFYGNQIYLKWNSVPGATGYRVYIIKDGVAQYLKTTNSASVTIGGAVEGKSYTYVVRSYRTVNKQTILGSESYKYKVTFNYANPTNVAISNIKATSADVSWTQARFASGYRVYIYDNATKSYKFYRYVNSSNTSMAIEGLNSKTTYKIKLCTAFGSTDSTGIVKTFTTK